MIDTDKYEGHTPTPWMNEYDEELGEHIIESHDGMIADRVLGVDADLIADAPLLLAEVKRLREIEQEWLVMWATLEELNIVADVRKNMTLHGFVFPTDEDMEGEEE